MVDVLPSSCGSHMQLPPIKSLTAVFDPSHFGNAADVRADLEREDHSVAVLVTCSELGFEPDLLSGAKPGGMTIVQTVGGLTTAPGQQPHNDDAFSDRFTDPKIRHLIFCGHSQCDVFPSVLQDLEGYKNLLMYKYLEPALKRLHCHYPNQTANDQSRILLQESLLVQAELVGHRPDVSKRLQDGSLSLHIWIRDDASARLAVFDPVDGQFRFR